MFREGDYRGRVINELARDLRKNLTPTGRITIRRETGFVGKKD
jgi:hypothetical protein